VGGFSFFYEELIMMDLDADSDRKVLEMLANRLATRGFVRESYLGAVLEREQSFPTGLSTPDVGVAIPHADFVHVVRPAVAVARLRRPVAFRRMDDPNSTVPVELVFMMAVSDPDGQITLLQRFMHLFSRGEVLLALKGAATSAEVKAIFHRELESQAITG